jgi:hypothetical protein
MARSIHQPSSRSNTAVRDSPDGAQMDVDQRWQIVDSGRRVDDGDPAIEICELVFAQLFEFFAYLANRRRCTGGEYRLRLLSTIIAADRAFGEQGKECVLTEFVRRKEQELTSDAMPPVLR